MFFMILSNFKKLKACICFCLNLPPRFHTYPSHLRKINWLPIIDRVGCCIANTVFKYWNEIVPRHIHERFKPLICGYSTRWQMALDIPLREKVTPTLLAKREGWGGAHYDLISQKHAQTHTHTHTHTWRYTAHSGPSRLTHQFKYRFTSTAMCS